MADAGARHLRKHQTVAEKRLWRELRKLRQQGYHFRRQAPIESYIVDLPRWALLRSLCGTESKPMHVPPTPNPSPQGGGGPVGAGGTVRIQRRAGCAMSSQGRGGQVGVCGQLQVRAQTGAVSIGCAL
jgi:Protein of unknown function (DUF559)